MGGRVDERAAVSVGARVVGGWVGKWGMEEPAVCLLPLLAQPLELLPSPSPILPPLLPLLAAVRH